MSPKREWGGLRIQKVFRGLIIDGQCPVCKTTPTHFRYHGNDESGNYYRSEACGCGWYLYLSDPKPRQTRLI